jgi:hypothetical protein
LGLLARTDSVSAQVHIDVFKCGSKLRLEAKKVNMLPIEGVGTFLSNLDMLGGKSRVGN